MSQQHADAKALKVSKELKNAHNWKHLARWHGAGYYELQTESHTNKFLSVISERVGMLPR